MIFTEEFNPYQMPFIIIACLAFYVLFYYVITDKYIEKPGLKDLFLLFTATKHKTDLSENQRSTEFAKNRQFSALMLNFLFGANADNQLKTEIHSLPSF